MRILIANLLRLGDVIISLPIGRALKSYFRGSHIAYLVRENLKDIFVCAPYVDEVIEYKNKLSLLLMQSKLRKFDTVIFVMESNDFRLKMFSLLGIKRRIGFALSKNSGKYLTDIIYSEDIFYCMEDLFLKLLSPLKIQNLEKNIVPYLMPLKRNFEYFDSLLPKKYKRMAIHTDTYAASRKWPYYPELIKKIINELDDVYIVLTGKKRDFLILNSERVLDLRGNTSLSQLAALFKSVDIVVGSDTGATHLCRAVGTKTIMIFGPEDPQITVSSNNLAKIYPEINLNCKNQNDYFGIPFANIKRCKLERCSSMECQKNITPERVFESLKQIIEK